MLYEAERGLSPLDKGDGAGVQVVVELEHVPVFEVLEAVEVQVVHRNRTPVRGALVTARDLVGRARHPPFDAQSAGRGPDEGSLAGAHLAGEHDHAPRLKVGRQPRGQLLERGLVQPFELQGVPAQAYQRPGWRGSRSAGARGTLRVS